ncbi:MAG: PAS domain-containing protein [Promethearchaeota archaeon]
MSSTRKMASKEPKEEEMFKLLADSSSQGIIIFQDSKVIYANAALTKIGKYPLRIIRSWGIKDLINLVVEKDQKEALARFRSLSKGEGGKRHFECQFKTMDGSLRWVDIIGTSYKTRTKPIIQITISDITAHKLAEEALQESETKFRTMVENSLQGLIIIQDFQIVYANQASAEFSGYSIKELLSLSQQKVTDSIHQEDQAIVWSRMQDRLARKPVPPHYTFRAIRKDGSIRWGDLYSSYIEYRGKPAVLAAIVDITERHAAETKLRQSETSLAEAQRISHLGNWDWNIVTNEEHWSDEIYRIFGLAPQEFGATYEAFLESVHPDDREFVKKAVNEALYGKKIYDIDHRIIRPDESERIVHEKAEVTYGKDGKPIRMIGTVHDITELKQAQQALQDSEEKFRVLVEEISDWVWEMNSQGFFTYSNNAVEDILGYSAGQVLGCTPFDFLHSDEMNTTLEAYIGLFKGREPIRDIVSKFVHRDGSIIILEAKGRPILDKHGNLIGYRGIYRDITDRLRMMDQLRKLSEQI